jgi:hypothetical protein
MADIVKNAPILIIEITVRGEMFRDQGLGSMFKIVQFKKVLEMVRYIMTKCKGPLHDFTTLRLYDFHDFTTFARSRNSFLHCKSGF